MGVTTFGAWFETQAGRQDLIGQLAEMWKEAKGNGRPRASAVESVSDFVARAWAKAGGDEAAARAAMVTAGGEYHVFRQGGPPPGPPPPPPPSQAAPLAPPAPQPAPMVGDGPAAAAWRGRVESKLDALGTMVAALASALAPLLDLVENVQAEASSGEVAGTLGTTPDAAPSFYGADQAEPPGDAAGWWDALAAQARAGDDPAG